MDARQTMKEGETFLAMLTHCMQNNLWVDMIVDQAGLERASGFIKSIDAIDGRDEVQLENGQTFEVSAVVAVNGVFAIDYTGC